VYIETGDERSLAARSQRGDGLPPEWEPYFCSTAASDDWFLLQMVHYDVGNTGVPVPLPPLAAGKHCQIGFTIAWFPDGEEGNMTHHYPEFSVEQILPGTGCS